MGMHRWQYGYASLAVWVSHFLLVHTGRYWSNASVLGYRRHTAFLKPNTLSCRCTESVPLVGGQVPRRKVSNTASLEAIFFTTSEQRSLSVIRSAGIYLATTHINRISRAAVIMCPRGAARYGRDRADRLGTPRTWHQRVCPA